MDDDAQRPALGGPLGSLNWIPRYLAEKAWDAIAQKGFDPPGQIPALLDRNDLTQFKQALLCNHLCKKAANLEAIFGNINCRIDGVV